MTVLDPEPVRAAGELSLSRNSGRRLTVAGGTGAGGSAVAAVPRLTSPCSGTVPLDGHELTGHDPGGERAVIGRLRPGAFFT
jgi:ABC-type methionine transport system ATPase subunit